VACGTVGVEDLLSGSNISGEGGRDGNTDSDCGTGNGGLDGLKSGNAVGRRRREKQVRSVES
jgi:hypothetical protein